MILVKFEKTIQVNEDEWRNVWIEKVFDEFTTLNEIIEWAKNNQDKPRTLGINDVQKLDVRGLIITEI
jgi:translation elongation factor EF-Tu-like GTPase